MCIPLRTLIAALTHVVLPHSPFALSVVVALLYFAVALGFVRTAVLDNHIGCFGGYAWWAPNRPFHAVLWFVAAVLVVCQEYTGAAAVLYGDVVFGLVTKCFASTKTTARFNEEGI